MKCGCICHIKPTQRDSHVMPGSGWVIWCCRKPYSSDPPELPPPVLIKNELVEIKPMDTPITKIIAFDYRYGDILSEESEEKTLMDCVREFNLPKSTEDE